MAQLIKRENYMTPGQLKKSLRSLELYLAGNRWDKIKVQGGYNWSEFSRLLVKFPDLSKAYSEARRSSGHSFEDKALRLAEELTGANEFTGTQVQAHKAAMEQYRWSAARRNPAEYAEAGAKQISLVVPIQINSSLDLGGNGEGPSAPPPNVWETHSAIINAAPTEGDGEVLAPSGLPVALEAVREAVGMPLEVPVAVKKRPSPGRPKKGHKSANLTSISRTNLLKKAARNPVTARALGLDKDPTK